jgi:hypothetical protein
MGIIMSAASVYVPDSEDLRPDISFSTVFQHHKLDNYGTVRVPTLFSELVQRTLLLGSSHPPLRLSPLLQSGCKADSSRLNQHEVCLSCRGSDRCPSEDLSMSKQVTLSSSCNLDHAQTVDQTASLAL